MYENTMICHFLAELVILLNIYMIDRIYTVCKMIDNLEKLEQSTKQRIYSNYKSPLLSLEM